MEKQRGRGRPPTFLRADREYLAGLIREHGITGAQRAARFAVCHRTLIGIARDFGIELRKGRRPRLVADLEREWAWRRFVGSDFAARKSANVVDQDRATSYEGMIASCLEQSQ